MEFNSLSELKLRITPALETRVTELHNNNINDISSEDIWNYLKDREWSNSHDLTLAKMVNDILKCNILDIRLYKIEN